MTDQANDTSNQAANVSDGHSALPLHGVRVLEITKVLAGPYAGALLRKLGAEVVKIEDPEGGDPFRNWAGADSPGFAQFNLGKQSVAIDLSDERGAEVIRQILPQFDVLLENSRPGRMERIGLSPDQCLAINPTLVYVSVTGFGDVGPLANRPAYDVIGQSVAGFFGLVNQGDQPPVIGPAIGDLTTGIVSAAGALAGLVSRERSGRGMVVATSMLEAIVALIGDAFTSWSAGGRTPTDAVRKRQSQVFVLQVADGRYVVLHLSTSQKFFGNLCRAVGQEHLVTDPAFSTYTARMENYDALAQELENTFAKRPSSEWNSLLEDADVPYSMVLTIAEVLDLEQVEQLELFSEPVQGGLRYLRGPWRFNGQRPPADDRAPALGEHTKKVLEGTIGREDIESLHRSGVIGLGDS